MGELIVNVKVADEVLDIFKQLYLMRYPIEKLHEIYKAKIYKSFSFDEISNKSYEEFREEQESELAKWSIDNDCSMFWKDDKEET